MSDDLSASAGSAAEGGPHAPRADAPTPRSAPESGPGDPDYVPAPRVQRPRRRRSVTESLLSIVLLLEAIVLLFVVLVFFGLKTVPPAVAFGGGAAAIVVILITVGLLRWAAGVALGWLIQLALIALGILNPVMYVVGIGFAAFWTWCFVRGRQIDVRRASYLIAHPDATESSATPEGDTP